MMLLREVFSIVLLFAPMEAATGHLPHSDVQMISARSNRTARAETMDAGGYPLTFFARFKCARVALRHDAPSRYTADSLHAAGEAPQNRILLPLMKGAMRLVTSYVATADRAGYRMPTTTLMIGIRG
jgi:hypothetical protein